MNAIVRNEIRLIGPAWIAGMIAAIAPIWITGMTYFGDRNINFYQDNGPFNRCLAVLAIAGLLISLASFASEVNCNTLASLLSQPRALGDLADENPRSPFGVRIHLSGKLPFNMELDFRVALL